MCAKGLEPKEEREVSRGWLLADGEAKTSNHPANTDPFDGRATGVGLEDDVNAFLGSPDNNNLDDRKQTIASEITTIAHEAAGDIERGSRGEALPSLASRSSLTSTAGNRSPRRSPRPARKVQGWKEDLRGRFMNKHIFDRDVASLHE